MKIDFFNTFYHELTHLYQRFRVNKRISRLDNIIAKERKLMKLDPNFYKENYSNLMLKKEAYLIGEIYSLYYFYSLGLIKIGPDFKLFSINHEEKLLSEENYERIIFGEKQNINDYFRSIEEAVR